MSPTEYVPLSPEQIQLLRIKADRGELTAEDTRAFILATRSAFTALPSKKPSASKAKSTGEAAAKLPPTNVVDFF